jgi:hypothetical protein
VDRSVSADGPASTPAHIHNREGKEKNLGLCFFWFGLDEDLGNILATIPRWL